MTELAGYLAEPFLQRALLAGLFVSFLSGVLGVFVVFKGGAFFGDAVAHASLAGVALGLLVGTQPLATALVVALALTLLLHAVARSGVVALDTALGLVFALGMSVGVILLSLRQGYQPELMSFLFGSILSVGWTDVGVIALFTVAASLVVWRFRDEMLFATFDPTSAHANGVNVERMDLLFQVLLTVTVVAGISLLGVVLVNALLVIPAATARLVSGSTRTMMRLTPAVGLAATVAGTFLSVAWDLPTGPTIVVVASGGFLATLVATRGRR